MKTRDKLMLEEVTMELLSAMHAFAKLNVTPGAFTKTGVDSGFYHSDVIDQVFKQSKKALANKFQDWHNDNPFPRRH